MRIKLSKTKILMTKMYKLSLYREKKGNKTDRKENN